MPESIDATPVSPGSVPDSRDSGLVGRRVGPYEILEEVGHGGMSVVYRGRDTRLDREVAVKVLHPFLADREDARRRFEREARAVAKLHHPNILEIYDFSDEGTEQSYIVTELVRGETLRQFAERVEVDPPELVALIGARICAALECAHALGIVHRDVKPENVMLDQSGGVKLMDFGIAHMRDASSLTLTGTLLGSPAHMAPEAIDGDAIDERADQFSLGTILYWLSTGKLPFTGKNPHALLKKISDGRYTPPQRVNPKISDRLADVIGTALASAPARRFATIGDLRDALVGVLREGEVVDEDETLRRFYQEPQPTRAVLTRTVVEAFTRRAHTQHRQGETALALGAINRVLAMEPDNSAARAELEAITRRMRFAALRRRLTRVVGLSAALALVLAVAIWFARREAQAPVPVAQLSEAPIIGDTPIGDATGPAAIAPPDRPPTRESITKPKGRERIALERRRPGTPAPGTTLDQALREITLRVDPWADIYVDDELRIRGSKIATLKLAPGPHTLRFENRFVAPVLREVDIPAEGNVPALAVKLVEMKPAYLVVEVEPDAEIKVDGTYKGPASASRRAPVVIAIPDRMGSAVRSVELSREGYLPQVVEQRFVPGETVRLRAALSLRPAPDEPDAAAGAAPPEPAPTPDP